MTGPEHYAEAARLLGEVVEDDGTPRVEPYPWDTATIAVAQLHATLALVAAHDGPAWAAAELRRIAATRRAHNELSRPLTADEWLWHDDLISRADELSPPLAHRTADTLSDRIAQRKERAT